MDQWNIIFNRGATYQKGITVTGIPNIASATEWRMTFANAVDGVYLTASTLNGMITAGATPSQKTLTVSAALTETFTVANGRYDFEIMWAGNVVERYIANGLVQVNPAAGE